VCAYRIEACQREAKFIALLRDPIKRAYSHYLMEVRDGWVNDSFEAALEKELREIASSSAPYAGHYHFIRGSRYVDGLLAFVDCFGPENVRVLRFEDLVADTASCVESLCAFLEIPAFAYDNKPEARNESSSARPRFASWAAARYRHSRARRFITPLAPDGLRRRVIEFLQKPRPSKHPVPEMTKRARDLLTSHLGGELDDALQLAEQFGILHRPG
jgi:hypothetical protein